MTEYPIARQRLRNHSLSAPACDRAEDVVRTMVAMQAQDYQNVLWAVGVRMNVASEDVVEQALRDGQIVRTWPLRGTLHLLAAQDVHWLLAHFTPHVLARSAARHRQLELDDTDFSRAASLFRSALHGGNHLTRQDMMAILETDGITTGGQRGYHILWRLAQEGVICFGPRAGKQDTFVRLDEWVPEGKTLSREEALTELAWRYFSSHGPATRQDFMWWSGLPAGEARTALELAGPLLCPTMVGKTRYWSASTGQGTSAIPPRALLLPAYDEYLLGYRHRGDVLDREHAHRIAPGGNGVFKPTVVIDGCVVGTWKRTVRKQRVSITLDLFCPLGQTEVGAIAAAANAYADFLGLPVDLYP